MFALSKKIFFIFLLSIPILVFGQDWTSSGASDTVFIKISVRMLGVSWYIDTLDDGWDDNSAVDSTWHLDSGSSYDSFYTDIGKIDPCSLAVPSYWIENWGGITLDIMMRADVGPTWQIHPDSFTCAGLAGLVNQMGVGVVAMIANGIIDDFMPSDMNSDCIPPVTGSWSEIDSTSFHPTSGFQYYPYLGHSETNLIADDPLAGTIEDGNYRRDNDQMEIYFYITPPTISSATGPQIINFWIKAKISD